MDRKLIVLSLIKSTLLIVPNAHIEWIENADARLKAIRDVDAGSFPTAFHFSSFWCKFYLFIFFPSLILQILFIYFSHP